MDKEAIEKIIEIQRRHVNANIWAEENAIEIMGKLRQLGYCKVSGEPPLLSEEEISNILRECDYTFADSRHNAIAPDEYEAIAQAQRKLDIEYYGLS